MPASFGIKTLIIAAALTAAMAIGLLKPPARNAASFASVQVTMRSGAALNVGRDEITFGLWMDCVASGACEHRPTIAAPSGDYPVTDVNALDITQFVTWLNKKDSANWRLPTRQEAQEFADLLPRDEASKLFTDPRMNWASDYYARKAYTRAVRPSGAFGALKNGLRDIGGNVWEWTSTCISKDLGRSPCPAYFVNGEHEAVIPTFLRDAVSGGCAAGMPPTNLGFRLVVDVRT